jgi:cell division protein FtsB
VFIARPNALVFWSGVDFLNVNEALSIFCRRLYKTLVCVAFAIVLVGGVMVILPKVAHYRRLSQQRDEQLRKIEYKSHEVKVLKDKQQRFKTDPEFVEYIARINKRVFPGELVFIFESEQGR